MTIAEPVADDYETIFNARGHLYNQAHELCPFARERERLAVIERLALNAGDIVCDIPAGGGYLAEGIRAYYGCDVQVICVEPSVRFAAAIDQRFPVIHEPIGEIASLTTGKVDAIASLAGLHHCQARQPIYREWARLLKPGGRLVVADVEAGTGTADFLNVFVDTWTPGGHQGLFVKPQEWHQQLTHCGFIHVTEVRQSVPWHFASADIMVAFCRALFGLQQVSNQALLQAIEHYVGVERQPTGSVAMQWELRVGAATRA